MYLIIYYILSVKTSVLRKMPHMHVHGIVNNVTICLLENNSKKLFTRAWLWKLSILNQILYFTPAHTSSRLELDIFIYKMSFL